MLSNRIALAALGIACVAAAAGGGYFATRNNATDRAASSASTAYVTPTDEALPPSAPTTAAEPATQVESAPAAASAQSDSPRTQPAPSKPATKPAPAPAPVTTVTPARAEHRAAAQERSSAGVSEPIPVPPVDPPAAVRVEEHPVEPAKPADPPEPTFDELTVAADSVIGVQMETALSSERARIEDRVEARVVRDVRVGGRVAIPAGARALGSVVVVERGGKMRDRARLGIRFHTLALADGTRLPISTETIYRLGDAPGNNSAAKIGGGAVAGAILGAIIGGGKGAAIGATTGAAGGSAAVMASDRSEAVFPAGAEVTARIVAPVTVTVDR